MALSDAGGILASPLTIIDRGDELPALEAILTIIDQHQVGQIIVGLPRSMNGSLGPQAEKVKSFVQELGKRTDAPIAFRDERLTTVLAQRLMRAATTKKSKRKARDDAVAAALILQSYLDEAQNS